MCETLCDFFLIILSIFFPPLPVLLKRGCGGDLLLNIILCIIGWLPGVIHAIYVVCTTTEVHIYHHHHDQVYH